MLAVAVALVLVVENGPEPGLIGIGTRVISEELLRSRHANREQPDRVAACRCRTAQTYSNADTNALWPRGMTHCFGGDGLGECLFRVAQSCCRGRSTMLKSTTLSANNRKVQRARPLGDRKQPRAISWILIAVENPAIPAVARVACG